MDFIIDRAVSHGQTAVGGLCQMSSIRWADGSERPWIDGIDPALLDPLIHFCRMCCIVFLYMFCNLERSEAGFLIDCCRCFERARSLASDPHLTKSTRRARQISIKISATSRSKLQPGQPSPHGVGPPDGPKQPLLLRSLAFWRTNTYAPYPIWLWLNGHSWAVRQLDKARIPYEALDNGFRWCADPVALQRWLLAATPASYIRSSSSKPVCSSKRESVRAASRWRSGALWPGSVPGHGAGRGAAGLATR